MCSLIYATLIVSFLPLTCDLDLGIGGLRKGLATRREAPRSTCTQVSLGSSH